MKATAYLLQRFIINGFRSLIKKKSALISYIVIAALIVFMLVSTGNIETNGVQNLDAYFAIVTGVYLLILCLSVSSGLKKGAALFSMADVNLLFTSPVNPRRVLIYGVLHQAGTLVLASLFLIAQYGNLRSNFGLGGTALVGLMIGYILFGVFSQLLCANLYAMCASRPNVRKRITLVIRGLLVALAAAVVFFATQNSGGSAFEPILKVLGGSWWDYIPAIGWMRAVAVYFAQGDFSNAALFIVLSLASCGAMLVWLFRSEADYYEDVLSAAENAYNVKQLASEGKLAAASASKRAKREIAPLKGKGASAFFYRSIREQTRKSSWLFSLSTIGAVISPCFGLIMFSDGDLSLGLWPVLYFAAYMLCFLTMNNNVSTELTHHYLFLAPAGNVGKLFAVAATQMLKHSVDTVVFLALSALLLKMPLVDVLGGTLVYFSLGIVFSSGMLLVERLLGSLKNKFAIVMLYILTLVLLVLPGFVAGTLLYTSVSAPLGYIACAALNLLAGLLITVLCQSLLNEMAK